MQHCKYNKEKKKNFKRKQGKERDRQLIPLSKCITTANQMPGCPFLCGPLCPALWDTCGCALAILSRCTERSPAPRGMVIKI